MNTEVFVVGGGPAGLAGAIAARQRGFAVTLVERSHPPLERACGEGIMPGGVAALRSLGVTVPPGLSCPFRGIRFVENGMVAQAAFTGHHGLGMRRTVLHQLLVERAQDLGVTMHWGRAVSSDEDGVRCDGERVRCDWLICADGRRSRMRDWAAFAPVTIQSERIGMRQHFHVTPVPEYVEVHWHAGGQAYITPVNSHEVCVVLMGAHPSMRMEEVWKLFPAVQERLGAAHPSDTMKGGVSATLRVKRVTCDNLALLGDAAGSIDAITGEGLSLAFRQALILGNALSRGNLALYEATHRSLEYASRLMERVLLVLASRSWLRQRTLMALAARPDLFTRMLAVHTGRLPLRAVGVRSLAALLLQVLCAGRTRRSGDRSRSLA